MATKIMNKTQILTKGSKVAFSSSASVSKKKSVQEVLNEMKKVYGNCFKTSNVQICGSLYQEFKNQGWKRYQDVSKDGIVTEANYFDNLQIVGNQSKQTVVMFPGSPGHVSHFEHLISHLTNQGVRVIAMTFPDMSLTRQVKFFRHSPKERVEFAKAVFQELSFNSDIDVLVSHSSGTFAGINLWKDFSTRSKVSQKVKSLTWLNPLGHEVTVPMQPYWLTSRIVKNYQKDGPRMFIEKFGIPFLAALGNPFIKSKIDDIIWGGCCLHYNNRQIMKEDLNTLVEKKLPILVIMSDNDAVMNKSMNRVLMSTLGTSDDKATIYDKEGNLERIGATSDRLKVIRTKSGGHFSFIKFPQIVNQELDEHLARMARKHSNLDIVEPLVEEELELYENWQEMQKVTKRARVNFA